MPNDGTTIDMYETASFHDGMHYRAFASTITRVCIPSYRVSVSKTAQQKSQYCSLSLPSSLPGLLCQECLTKNIGDKGINHDMVLCKSMIGSLGHS